MHWFEQSVAVQPQGVLLVRQGGHRGKGRTCKAGGGRIIVFCR